jgi:protein required for attachment to host cells
MLRWLKTVVVGDEEKAHVMRQAGAWKTTTAEAS